MMLHAGYEARPRVYHAAALRHAKRYLLVLVAVLYPPRGVPAIDHALNSHRQAYTDQASTALVPMGRHGTHNTRVPRCAQG